MKKHVRLLLAVAVAVLVVAGFALKSDNDALAAQLSATTTAHANQAQPAQEGSTP